MKYNLQIKVIYFCYIINGKNLKKGKLAWKKLKKLRKMKSIKMKLLLINNH